MVNSKQYNLSILVLLKIINNIMVPKYEFATLWGRVSMLQQLLFANSFSRNPEKIFYDYSLIVSRVINQ
jgi:hypothetical protein